MVAVTMLHLKLLVFLVSVLLYLSSVGYPFMFEDADELSRSSMLTVAQMFTLEIGSYRPLAFLTIRPLCTTLGLSARHFRMLLVTINAVVSVLACDVLSIFLDGDKKKRRRRKTKKRKTEMVRSQSRARTTSSSNNSSGGPPQLPSPSVIAASMLFCAHPFRSETVLVGTVVGLTRCLSTMFALTAFLLLHRSKNNNSNNNNNAKLMSLSVVFFVVSALYDVSNLAMLLACVVLGWWCDVVQRAQQNGSGGTALKRSSLICAVSLSAYFLVRFTFLRSSLWKFQTVSVWEMVASAPQIIIYTLRCFLPFTVSLDSAASFIGVSWPLLVAAVCCLALSVILVAWKSPQNIPLISFYLCLIVPAGTSISERTLYSPVLALCALFGRYLPTRKQTWTVGLLVLILSTRTAFRVQEASSETSLLISARSSSPYSTRVMCEYANLLRVATPLPLEVGHQAESLLKEAISMKPHSAVEPLVLLALLYADENSPMVDAKKALRYAREAVDSAKSPATFQTSARYAMGRALVAARKLQDAIRYLEDAANNNNNASVGGADVWEPSISTQASCVLGACYYRAKAYPKAARQLQRCVDREAALPAGVDPRRHAVHYANLGAAHQVQHQHRRALHSYERSLELDTGTRQAPVIESEIRRLRAKLDADTTWDGGK